MRRRNTTEYQNLFEPSPYCSVHRISYSAASPARDVAMDAPIRRGATGYDANETVFVGPPGDPRYFRTGTATMGRHYRNPGELRTRDSEQIPNIVERSGYWAE
jgi:hypothetical protein